MGKLIDNIIAFKLLKMIVTPFDKTEAFNLGIIDENGKVIKKAKTLSKQSEQDAYNYLTRLVFNVKRLINKFGGENRLKSLAAALYLFKEHNENLSQLMITEESEAEFEQLLEDTFCFLVEDDNDTYLDIETVKAFIKEEMVTIAAIPKDASGETTPVVKKKKYKILKRDIKEELGE